MVNNQITDHFTLEEFSRSSTAKRMGINNRIPDHLIDNIKITANGLEQVRKALGHPIIITSGYRCEELNGKVGGKVGSSHTFGLAADFHSSYGTPREICQKIIDSGIAFDKLVQEYNQWVHIGFSTDSHRRLVSTAIKSGGKTIYKVGLV